MMHLNIDFIAGYGWALLSVLVTCWATKKFSKKEHQ